ncbi:hypothetical protein [Thalassotalea sediminis]|uniref:hypothetical protein n=1 Tax=Thalassotalea sediminis TaxID=1759089 RepID=UPI0025740510|nr:hypothetical protein [Thalassotalea sediminis]
MINNINNYSNLFNSNTTNSSSTTEVDDIIANKKQQIDANIAPSLSYNNSLFLSSKAQKISAINNEFFSGGSLNFDDLDSLKSRVYQLGLITKEEFGKLTNTEYSEQELAAADDISTQGIANYINNFLKRLDESDAGKNETNDTVDKQTSDVEESESLIALKAALNNAKNIITDVENAKSKEDFKATLIKSMSILNESITAQAFEKMPIDDKVGLTKVYQTLEIVDKISPQRLTNQKLNHYMSISLV